ncbi:MAG: glycoside hydrolase family 127 protein [Ruminococcaceae bacterium]|nr:glycoside hydrolase family 127 protein [Oscillospiraceae bacterium]
MKHYASVPFTQVKLSDGFWKNKQTMNEQISIGSVYNRFRDTGRIDAFRCDWRDGMPNKPHFFWDSDVAKWIEAASYVLARTSRPDLEEKIEWLVEQIVKNQCEDGYFNIYFQTIEPAARFTRRNAHELYCTGHLMEAAVAYYNATGRRAFLDAMCRCADLIAEEFMEKDSAAFVTPGHEEIELALIKLYRATGVEKYRDLAKFFIDQRGNNDKDRPLSDAYKNPYNQAHLPCREQNTAEGHSVRAVYLYSGMCDVADAYEDEELLNACVTLFDNITEKRMYITGGIGSSAKGEQFTVDYDLPNKEAYSESCAAIGLAFFARRMQEHFADSRYADTVERVLYNGFLSSVSLDGKAFFYENPLEIDLALHARNKKMETGRFPITQRKEVFGCSCCPPNITRFFASLGDYLYTYGEDTLFVHQYMNSEAEFDMNGMTVSVTQRGDYPGSGVLSFDVRGLRGTLALRIPGWCAAYELNFPHTLHDGYAYITVTEDCSVTLTLDMTPYYVAADPRVQNNAGRTAVMRGPVVYCLEGVDNGENLHGIVLDTDGEIRVSADPASGLTVLDVPARRMHAPTLYSRLNTMQTERITARMIPYSSFANRGESDMLVWVNAR